jgi:hypothetical protein
MHASRLPECFFRFPKTWLNHLCVVCQRFCVSVVQSGDWDNAKRATYARALVSKDPASSGLQAWSAWILVSRPANTCTNWTQCDIVDTLSSLLLTNGCSFSRATAIVRVTMSAKTSCSQGGTTQGARALWGCKLHEATLAT